MLRRNLGAGFLALAAIVLLGNTLLAAPPKDKDKDKEKSETSVAAHWDWTMFDDKDKVIEKGSFNVRGFALMKDGRRIGTYSEVSDTEVKVEVEEGKLKGKMTLTKAKASDVNWEGVIDSDKKGQSYKVTFSFVKAIK